MESTPATSSAAAAAAACEVIDLTESREASVAAAPARAAVASGSKANVVDLTTIDNPCYDPTETEAQYGYFTGREQQSEEGNKGKMTHHTTPDSVTWENLFPNLPESVQQQFGDGHAEARGGEDEVGDDLFDQEAQPLIDLTDRVAAEADESSPAEPCPICSTGRLVEVTFNNNGISYTSLRCSDSKCGYEEFDD